MNDVTLLGIHNGSTEVNGVRYAYFTNLSSIYGDWWGFSDTFQKYELYPGAGANYNDSPEPPDDGSEFCFDQYGKPIPC
jgi:hypothetical protein